MSTTTFKNQALESLKGKWGNAVIAALIYFFIAGCISGTSSFTFGIPTILISIPMGWGFSIYFLRIARKEDVDVSSLFDGFKDYGRILLTGMLMALYGLLWTLLLIIPGIIKSYSYAQTYFILKDNPELRYNGAIERSMKMMDGHKMDLFLLDLSFIGWYLLCVLTLGLGLLLVIPYHYTAKAHFYEMLKQAEPAAE
ncbi:MAG: DUF975 family protein [Bacteroidaceae bacterium]|nr:DUF975 family protein [Bacteroidaceae bacterium]